jgi:hypothetical protein
MSENSPNLVALVGDLGPDKEVSVLNLLLQQPQPPRLMSADEPGLHAQAASEQIIEML